MTSRIIRSAYGGARETARLRAIHERETPTSERPVGYTSMVGVSDESATIPRGPVALAYSKTAGPLRTPGVRR